MSACLPEGRCRRPWRPSAGSVALLALVVSLCACEPQPMWQQDFERGMAEAKRLDRPAFVYFDAAWCSWCQAYKRDTLADARLYRLLAHRFVPIIVDFDARPDLVARYRVRGLPYTLVLAPDGRVRNGFVGNLTAVDLIDVLDASVARDQAGPSATEVVAQVSMLNRAELVRFQAAFLQYLEQLYSNEHGTLLGRFDTGATLKRPSPMTWMYLMERGLWSARATSALAAERERLFDRVDGGFFNFLDPSRVTEEYLETSKLLESNAWLTAWFARAAIRDPAYRDTARGGYAFLTSRLWDRERSGFFQAQVADQIYYTLEPAARRATTAPALDRIKRADTNAQAALALIDYAMSAQEREAMEYAARTLDFILRELHRDGQLHHSIRNGDRSEVAPLLDALWLLAAGAKLQAVRPEASRDAALANIARRTAVDIDARMQRREAAALTVEEAGLLAWVALQQPYVKMFGPTIAPWALKQLRIETDTPPDDVVFGLRAWERLTERAR